MERMNGFKRCLSIFLIIVLSAFAGCAAYAMPPPYKQQDFENVFELTDWISTVDYAEADMCNVYANEAYKFKPFLEILRQDGEILLPKYGDQSFPINIEEGHLAANICPDVPFEQRYYGFRAKVDQFISITINRIDDEYISMANENYDEYIKQRYPKAVRYDYSTDQYQSVHIIIDQKYDVIIHIYSDQIDAHIMDKISFEKVKLNNAGIKMPTFTSEGYTIGKIEPRRLKTHEWITVTASGAMVVLAVIWFCGEMKKRKTVK